MRFLDFTLPFRVLGSGFGLGHVLSDGRVGNPFNLIAMPEAVVSAACTPSGRETPTDP